MEKRGSLLDDLNRVLATALGTVIGAQLQVVVQGDERSCLLCGELDPPCAFLPVGAGAGENGATFTGDDQVFPLAGDA